jgi:hypothetical protein
MHPLKSTDTVRLGTIEVRVSVKTG